MPSSCRVSPFCECDAIIELKHDFGRNDNVEGVPNSGIVGQLPTAQSIHLPSTQSARLPSTQLARLYTAQSAHAHPSQVVHSCQLAMHPQGPHPSVAMGAPLPTLPPIGVLSPQVQWNLPSAAERKTSSVRTTNRPVAGCSAVSGASMNAGHHNPSGGVQAGGPGQPADAQGFARGEWRIGNSRTLKLSVHQGVWPWMPPPSTPGILVLRERLHIRRKQDPRGRDLSCSTVSVGHIIPSWRRLKVSQTSMLLALSDQQP